jgi:glycosyltransferase involved in cell wall biosynthesis
MKISFLTSGHDPMDDRIFYHMAGSLYSAGRDVLIISSRKELTGTTGNIRMNCFDGNSLPKREKISNFIGRLSEFGPDLIICSEPLTVLAARKYVKQHDRKAKIIYDITEWYPSKKNLTGHSRWIKWSMFLKLLFFNLWVSSLADSFIFGEWYKSRPYRLLYSRKPFIYISYYPDLRYIPFLRPELIPGKIRLSYSGRISLEKGFGNFINAIRKLTRQRNDLKIEIKIIGWYHDPSDKAECQGLFQDLGPSVTIKLFDKQDFNNYLELIKDTDIFLDLRAADLENRHCLPIKLFYYAAFGRPLIFSDLRAIGKEVEINRFGYLVDPRDDDRIAEVISNYLEDNTLYYNHCAEARFAAENKYNWKLSEPLFIDFIHSLEKSLL